MGRLIVFLICLTNLPSAFAAEENSRHLTCKSDNFPANFGSTLRLSLDATNKLFEANLYLEHGDSFFKTNGWFRGFSSLNENATPVIYFNWYAGAGSENELKLIPKQFFIVEPNSNRMYIGFFDWQGEDKIIRYFIYQCLGE